MGTRLGGWAFSSAGCCCDLGLLCRQYGWAGEGCAGRSIGANVLFKDGRERPCSRAGSGRRVIVGQAPCQAQRPAARQQALLAALREPPRPPLRRSKAKPCHTGAAPGSPCLLESSIAAPACWDLSPAAAWAAGCWCCFFFLPIERVGFSCCPRGLGTSCQALRVPELGCEERREWGRGPTVAAAPCSVWSSSAV